VSGYDASTVITATSPLSLLLDSVSSSQSGLTITALSEFVNSRAVGEMNGLSASAAVRKFARKGLHRAATTSVTEAQAHADASALLLGFFGLTSTDIPESLPSSFSAADLTANPDWFQLGLVLGGYAEEGYAIDPNSIDDLIAALSSDIKDGVFDGLNNTTPIAVGSGTTITLSSSAGTSDFLLALGTDVSSGQLIAALEAAGASMTQIQALQAKILNGVYSSSATPSSSSLGSGNSGAVTSYSANGKQYLILAARSEGVVVIDVTDSTAAAPTVNTWTSISQSIFGGLDVGLTCPRKTQPVVAGVLS
jgi:hypothetical protein